MKRPSAVSDIPPSLSPMPTPAEILARVRTLAPHANDNIANQHVVSKVLLGQFTEPWGKNQAMQLAGLELARASQSPRWGGPNKFGKVPNFVQFASNLVERVWKDTEDKLRPALDAIDDRTIFDQPTMRMDTIRDTVILHFVRSIPAALLHNHAWNQRREAHLKNWLQYPEVLEYLYYQRFGLYPAGPEALEIIACDLINQVRDLVERGAILRVSLEDRYDRYRMAVRSYGIEIFVPQSGEFLIGDAPALTIRHGEHRFGLGEIGLANADEIVLPIGPHHLVVLGRHDRLIFKEIPEERVRDYNVMQIRAAHKHVHFRPGSGLEKLARSVISSQ